MSFTSKTSSSSSHPNNTDSNWSKHGKDYNAGQSKPFTYSAIKTCLDSEIFHLLDQKFEKVQNAKDAKKVQMLILACGTGSELMVLFDRYGKGFLEDRIEILATDYAKGMVEVTKELVKKLEAEDFVKVQSLDAQDLSTIPTDSQDVVLFPFGPMILPDPIKSLSEIRRTLKPNGEGLSVNITPSTLDMYSILEDSKAKVLEFKGMTREKNQEMNWSFYDSRAIQQWGKKENVGNHFEKSGFEGKRIRAEEVECKVEVEDWKSMLESLKTNPGMSYFWIELSSTEVDTFWSQAYEALKERYGEDGKCEMVQGVVLSWAWK